MPDIKPIFHVLCDVVNAKLRAHANVLRRVGDTFDTAVEIVNSVHGVMIDDDVRDLIGRETGLPMNPRTYQKILSDTAQMEAHLNIPRVATQARVDAMYARDFFRTYRDVVREPQIAALARKCRALYDCIDKIEYLMDEFEERRIFGMSVPLTFRLMEYESLLQKYYFGQFLLRGATDLDFENTSKIFNVADDLMAGHRDFTQAVPMLMSEIKNMQKNQRQR